MKVAGGGFDQCYNAQAVVATGSMLIVATEVTQAANDKEQLVPMLEKLAALPQDLGRAEFMLADNGYLSQSNVEQCEAAQIEPLIAIGRGKQMYGLRKQNPELVFGIIKSVMGYRQCLLRGLKNVKVVESGDEELEHQANVRDASLLRGHRDHFGLQDRSNHP